MSVLSHTNYSFNFYNTAAISNQYNTSIGQVYLQQIKSCKRNDNYIIFETTMGDCHGSFADAINAKFADEYINSKIKKESKMKEMLSDVREYIKEHRSIIYTVLAVVVLDHFLLGGKLRGKLEGLLNGALDKAQEKLDGKSK